MLPAEILSAVMAGVRPADGDGVRRIFPGTTVFISFLPKRIFQTCKNGKGDYITGLKLNTAQAVPNFLGSRQVMKRVAQIVRKFAFEEWGGTESVVWNSSQHLLRNHIQPLILATKACSRAGNETIREIPIRRFDYFYPSFPLTREDRAQLDIQGGNPYCFGMRKFLMENDFSLLHIHTSSRVARFAAEAALKRHIPYLLTFHYGYFTTPAEETELRLRPLRGTFRYGNLIDRFAPWQLDIVEHAAAILCVGAGEVPEFQKRYPGKRVEHLPNGVDLEAGRRKSPVNLRQSLKIPEDRKIFLCVSRIDERKNQLHLLKITAEALKLSENLHLLLIGPPTSPRYYADLLRQAKAMGLDSRLTVIPGLPPDHDLLRAAYQQSNVFLLPSRHEPFGMVVLDAWAAGRPVIASAVDGLNFLIDNRRTGLLCPPDDTAAWLDALKYLDDFKTRDEMIRAAAAEAENYTWDKVAARLAHIYEEIGM